MSVTSGEIFVNVSMNASRTSVEIDMRDRGSLGIRLESAAATRAGSFVIEGKIGGGSWGSIAFFDITATLVTSIAVTAGVAVADDIQMGGPMNYDLLRVRFIDSTGGTGVGVLNGWVDRGTPG